MHEDDSGTADPASGSKTAAAPTAAENGTAQQAAVSFTAEISAMKAEMTEVLKNIKEDLKETVKSSISKEVEETVGGKIDESVASINKRISDGLDGVRDEISETIRSMWQQMGDLRSDFSSMEERSNKEKKDLESQIKRNEDHITELEKEGCGVQRRLRQLENQQENLRSERPSDSSMANIAHRQEMLDQEQRRCHLVAHGMSEDTAPQDLTGALEAMFDSESGAADVLSISSARRIGGNSGSSGSSAARRPRPVLIVFHNERDRYAALNKRATIRRQHGVRLDADLTVTQRKTRTILQPSYEELHNQGKVPHWRNAELWYWENGRRFQHRPPPPVRDAAAATSTAATAPNNASAGRGGSGQPNTTGDNSGGYGGSGRNSGGGGGGGGRIGHGRGGNAAPRGGGTGGRGRSAGYNNAASSAGRR